MRPGACAADPRSLLAGPHGGQGKESDSRFGDRGGSLAGKLSSRPSSRPASRSARRRALRARLASILASCSGVASFWWRAFPFGLGHAVDRLARLVAAEGAFGGFADPIGQAVAAEAGQAHQVDVLGVGAHPKMLDEAVERRCGEVVIDLGHGGAPGGWTASPYSVGGRAAIAAGGRLGPSPCDKQAPASPCPTPPPRPSLSSP